MRQTTPRRLTLRSLAVTDEKIDDVVYGLYGITKEEREIIKGRIQIL